MRSHDSRIHRLREHLHRAEHGRFSEPDGRGGRRGRVLDSNALQLVSLSLLDGQNRHGYEIIREIEAMTGGAYAPSPGMVYPTLSMLLEMGQIQEIEVEGARKTFAITPEGRTHKAENAEALAEALARLAALADATDRADPQPLRRAMGNLRQVLMAATAKPGFDDAKVLEAARQIDELAGTIERM